MKHGKIFFFIITVTIFLRFSSFTIFAQSEYVLPYPSAMPGSKLYPLHKIWEYVLQYWYFGDFTQFTYNLKESDKYLVEAKTLFEYKQYLLGYTSLQKSDDYFIKLPNTLNSARKNNKDISQKQYILKSAGEKHIEVLTETNRRVPKNFTWQPEKSQPTVLNLQETIEKSILIRRGVINETSN